jgi:hypothetical protein
MNVPAFVLLGFAGWTVLTLFGSIGVYRWSRILTGRASISEWRTDATQGSEWYQRAMRAHMRGEPADLRRARRGSDSHWLAKPISRCTLRGSSTCSDWTDSGPHVAPTTNVWAALRFALFFVQIVCIMLIGTVIVLSTMR